MNNNAKRWVEKLREPGLRQTMGILEDENGQCCLGVACAMYAEEYPDYPAGRTEKISPFGKKFLPLNEEDYFMTYGEFNEDAVLPEEVMEWLGIGNDLGIFESDTNKSLTEMNDQGSTFIEIADAIEKYEDVLFL